MLETLYILCAMLIHSTVIPLECGYDRSYNPTPIIVEIINTPTPTPTPIGYETLWIDDTPVLWHDYEISTDSRGNKNYWLSGYWKSNVVSFDPKKLGSGYCQLSIFDGTILDLEKNPMDYLAGLHVIFEGESIGELQTFNRLSSASIYPSTAICNKVIFSWINQL